MSGSMTQCTASALQYSARLSSHSSVIAKVHESHGTDNTRSDTCGHTTWQVTCSVEDSVRMWNPPQHSCVRRSLRPQRVLQRAFGVPTLVAAHSCSCGSTRAARASGENIPGTSGFWCTPCCPHSSRRGCGFRCRTRHSPVEPVGEPGDDSRYDALLLSRRQALLSVGLSLSQLAMPPTSGASDMVRPSLICCMHTVPPHCMICITCISFATRALTRSSALDNVHMPSL